MSALSSSYVRSDSAGRIFVLPDAPALPYFSGFVESRSAVPPQPTSPPSSLQRRSTFPSVWVSSLFPLAYAASARGGRSFGARRAWVSAALPTTLAASSRTHPKSPSSRSSSRLPSLQSHLGAPLSRVRCSRYAACSCGKATTSTCTGAVFYVAVLTNMAFIFALGYALSATIPSLDAAVSRKSG